MLSRATQRNAWRLVGLWRRSLGTDVPAAAGLHALGTTPRPPKPDRPARDHKPAAAVPTTPVTESTESPGPLSTPRHGAPLPASVRVPLERPAQASCDPEEGDEWREGMLRADRVGSDADRICWEEEGAAMRARVAKDGVTIVRSPEEATEALAHLQDAWTAHAESRGGPPFVVAADVETVGLEAADASQATSDDTRVVCMSLYAGPDVDFGDGPRLFVDNVDDARGTVEACAPVLQDPRIGKVWHNYSFDRRVLYQRHGIDCRGFAGDTMHMARLWDSSRRAGYSLEALSHDVLGDRKVPIKERFRMRKVLKNGFYGRSFEVPAIDALERSRDLLPDWIDYSTYDTQATWELYHKLAGYLADTPWEPNGLTLDTSKFRGPPSMLDLYVAHWLPFGELLTDMERRGIRVNTAHLAESERAADADRQRHLERFLAWAETISPGASSMNVGSPVQQRQLLFAPCENTKTGELMERERDFKVPNTEGIIEGDRTRPLKNRTLTLAGLGLEPVDWTATGWPSTSSAVISKLGGSIRDPAAVGDTAANAYGACYDQLLQRGLDEGLGEAEATARAHDAAVALDALGNMSAIDTMLSNFIRPLQTMTDEDSRIHCSFGLNTETGRLSARNPNLQNQPALEKDRYKVRDAFCASPGNRLIVSDFGQIELRVLAHMSDCASMQEAFTLGGDFHSRTAMGMYPYIGEAIANGEALMEWDDAEGDAPLPLVKDVYGSERRKAKVLNFSIAYGKTPIGLAKDFGVTLEEARETLDLWYADRPEVRAWQEATIEEARRVGYTTTLLGRRRILPGINSTNPGIRGHAERAAINTPIQGGAADIVGQAMVHIHHDPSLREMGWHLLLQVHDEVVMEGPEDTAPDALDRLKWLMCNAWEGSTVLLPATSVEMVVDASIGHTWYEAK